jgi:hypothetical protein
MAAIIFAAESQARGVLSERALGELIFTRAGNLAQASNFRKLGMFRNLRVVA